MNGTLKRALCLLLSLALTIQLAPVTLAEEKQTTLPEVALEEAILNTDVFYMATTAATLEEGANTSYLLRVGRGGEAATESSVLIKICDMTSVYGTDYTVSALDGSAEVVVPEDNFTLMDLLAGQSFDLIPLKDEEEAEAIFEEDEEGMAAAEAGIEEALNYLAERSGIGVKEESELDPVQQARNLYTGVDGKSQKVEATSDMYQQLQSVADVMTEVVPGAGIVLTFAPGETEKQLVLRPIDNEAGDGDRMFFLILSETEGSTTNSAASSCAVTIRDDEKQAQSVVSFSQATYSEIEDGMVTVTLHREGALNTVISVKVRSTGGSARVGRDYAEVDQELVFPFGVSDMPLQIPVQTKYFDGEADFTLELRDALACTVSDAPATVKLTGTGTAAETENAASSAIRGLPQTLTLVRTDEAINLADYYKKGYWITNDKIGSYNGHNSYNAGNGRWEMDWVSTWDQTGNVLVTWKLNSAGNAYWYSGARVTLETTGNHSNHHSEIEIALWGSLSSDEDWRIHQYCVVPAEISGYHSAQSFGKTAVDFYPSTDLMNAASAASGNPQKEALNYLTVINKGKCDDCNWLWVYKVEPILRPFQATLVDSAPVLFLQEDGSYAANPGDDALKANLSGTNDGKHQVVFLGDAVTVSQPSGTNVVRYVTLSGIEYVPVYNPGAAKLITSSSDLSSSSVTMELSKENISNMFSTVGSSFALNTALLDQYKAGSNASFYSNPNFSTQAPTYGDMQIRPKFDYIDASITLQNPYDFSVCYSISGTDYWVLPKQTRELQNIHLGDTLAVTGLRTGAGYETNYIPVGVDVSYCYKANTGDYIHDTKRFSNNNAIYFGGEDGRLCYEEVILSPNLTEMQTTIQVKVKTSELSKFESTGLLSLPSKVEGTYTYFTCVAPGQMVSGKIYPITAVPKSENTVCIWTVNSGNKYIGDCFLFEAGRAESAEDNLITLTTATAKMDMQLVGTLTYRDFNLRTRDMGNASTKPAAGAIVVAGNITATADDNGVLESTTMKVPSSPYRYKLRCMVVVNGFEVIRDIALPVHGNEVDISSTFDTGVSPAASPIFNTIHISVDGANTEGLVPVTNWEDSFNVSVQVKPVRYNVQRADGAGGYVTASRFEKPVSVQLKLVDSTGQLRYAFDPVVDAAVNSQTGEYTFTQVIPFQLDVADPENPDLIDTVYQAQPGDRLVLTLSTNLLEQASDLELTDEALDYIGESELLLSEDELAEYETRKYVYSEVNTGYALYTLNEYTPPVAQGLGDSPFEFEFNELPFLGSVGMNLQFPFVNVSWQRTASGYRMCLGVSPMHIIDKVKSDHTHLYHGDDGQYWGDLFAVGHPFKTAYQGLKESFKAAFAGREGQTKKDVAELGARQWRFDFAVGMAFDFFIGTVTDQYGISTTAFVLDGMGAYVSVTVGVRQTWYTIIPVVFIPAYFGIMIEASIMGVFEAHREDSTPNIVTYDDATTTPEINLAGAFNDTFLYNINAAGTVQISAGVGLCGTIGIRLVAEFGVIFNYEQPQTIEGVRDWGVYLTLKGGGMIDLFLSSVPVMFELVGLKYGKFEDFEDMAKGVEGRYSVLEGSDPFHYRTGSKETSEWLGNATETKGAFTPKQTYPLVENSYERSDPQLITLRSGTVVLAYLSNDPDKGPYQRTTLMLTTYQNGVWSEPVPVSEDSTADFQPSIAETQDGRVLIAWVSTEAADITEDTPTVDYLRSMEVYAAFAEIGADGAVTVGETSRVSHDRRAEEGQDAHYYDANPTVVCDTESGDAIVYYIKSGSVTEDPTELANPYVNDSVICYLPYDGAKDKWMTDEFYPSEAFSEEQAQYLLDNFCGQRFLEAPTFVNAEGEREYYAIPDFTAIGYDGKAIYAYTVDRDSSNDTDADKELFLQVFSFADHKTYYRIRLTDDVVADALPQFIRTEKEGQAANTKLFWYRAGLGVCYLDISTLLTKGINADGTLKPKADGSGNMATPILVDRAHEQQTEANQNADFYVTEDANGSIYVVWTDVVVDEDSDHPSQELFAVCQYADPQDGSAGSWSKPYQLTHSGLQNDELALTLDGSNLLVVHNQYAYTLTGNADEPLVVSNMTLAATTLEPCGSVATESVVLLPMAAEGEVQSADPVELVQPGQTVLAQLTISNDGLTTAEGYHVDVYQVSAAGETQVWSSDEETRIYPNTATIVSFPWTVPENLEGACLRVETTENHYSDVSVFESEPLEVRASYQITSVNPYQDAEGFHMAATLTNTGNAATAEGEYFTFYLTGPFGLDNRCSEEEKTLCRVPIEPLAPGESAEINVPLDVPADMMAAWRCIYGMAGVRRAVETLNFVGSPVTEQQWLGDTPHVEIFMSAPMDFTLHEGQPFDLAVGESAELNATLALGELLGGDEVTYSVGNPGVAQIADGKLLGVAEGETDVFAIHLPTGTAVSVPVTVHSGATENPFRDVEEGKYYYDAVLWAYHHDPQITAGTSADTFSPKDSATRAQVMTFLWHAAGNPDQGSEDGEAQNPFTDVKPGKYYSDAVLWAVENGITSGTGENKFSPNKECTRAEIVTFFWKYAGAPEPETTENPFSDVKQSAWYYKAVLWAFENGITSGTGNGKFSPKKECTRAEAMTFLYHAIGD